MHSDLVTVQHDWIDDWNLGTDNRELIADLDGDGRDEVLIRSPEWAGVLKLTGERLALQSIQHDWIDGWNLGGDNQEWVGRFTQRTRDEIMIRSPQWLGLLVWDPGARRLRLMRTEHPRVDGWALGPGDQHCVGDFDGDGLDEIYIRSAGWAGVIKWVTDRFRLLWIREGSIAYRLPQTPPTMPLEAADRSASGRFLPTRDGILHRRGDGVAVLTWEGTEMRVRSYLRSPFSGRWNLGPGDRFVLGDFQRIGRDVGDPTADYIADGLTDLFIHNGWGTGMVGVNHFDNPGNPGSEDQIGLTWINAREVLLPV